MQMQSYTIPINQIYHLKAARMVLFLLFTLLAICHANVSAGQPTDKKISLTLEQTTLKESLLQVEKLSGIPFTYSTEALAAQEKKITLTAQELTVKHALDQILAGTGLRHRVISGYVVIDPIPQQSPVRGTVKDASGNPISGATVQVKDHSLSRTSTNQRGGFTIDANSDDVLLITSIGFDPLEVPINNRRTLDVVMQEAVADLEEVVVTALGIERERRSLGYSVTELSGEDLTEALSNNWTEALSGKVAGLNMLKSGAGPAGSNQIILRGETSLSGDNAALIVVDGVVISGSSGQLTGTGSNPYLNQESPVDFGSSLADLNPEDIESVSVLKGPGAAALYGARGANGAIIITTKQGKREQQGVGITFNSNLSLATINRWPDYQHEYGQGLTANNFYYSYGATEDGPTTLSTSSAWGPRFDGQLFYQYSPDNYRQPATERTPWVAYPNNRKDFFETAYTYTNSLTLQGGNDRTTARLSFTNATNSWIVPNTGYARNTVALQVNQKLTDKLTVSSRVNYNNRHSDNLPTTGYNNQTIMYFIRGLVPNFDINWFKDYWIQGREGIEQRRPFSLQLDNPYLQAYEMLNKSNRNGIIGNVQASYDFTSELSLIVRTTMDFQYESRSQQRPWSTQKYANGMYREQDIYSQETNADFLLRYNNGRNDRFSYSLSFGGALMNNKYIRDEYRAENLARPNIYTLANSRDLLISMPYRREYAVNSLYGMATVGYKDFLYVDVTARQDWASTLAQPVHNRVTPFFYPALNVSAILSDIIQLPDVVSYLKLRGSVASVGSGGTTAYLTSYAYSPRQEFPSGLANPTTIPDLNLGFERTVSYEAGADIRMFKNRLNVDITAYHSNSFDQILISPVDPASGYANRTLNAGSVQNKGLEIEANGIPLNTSSGFNWRVYGTYATNIDRVVSLADSMSSMQLSTIFGSRGSIEARPGGRFRDMYGIGYQRSPDGQIIYNENGYPLQGDSLIYLGNPTPKWRFGFGNEFSYKRFRLNVLFDGQFGAKAFSLTHAVLMEEGKLKKSLPGRYHGIIGDGVIRNPDGTFRKNDVVATDIRDYYYLHFNRDNQESNMFSTDFIKLREVRLDYTLPTALANRLRLQRATLGVYGRDLLVFTNWPAFDPEFGTLGDGVIIPGAETAQFPSTRTIGFNLVIGL